MALPLVALVLIVSALALIVLAQKCIKNELELYLNEDFSLDHIDNKRILLSTIQYIKDTGRFLLRYIPSPSPPLPPPLSIVLQPYLIYFFTTIYLIFRFIVNLFFIFHHDLHVH